MTHVRSRAALCWRVPSDRHSASAGIIANNGTRIVSAVEKFGIGLSELRWGQSLPHYFNRCVVLLHCVGSIVSIVLMRCLFRSVVTL